MLRRTASIDCVLSLPWALPLIPDSIAHKNRPRDDLMAFAAEMPNLTEVILLVFG